MLLQQDGTVIGKGGHGKIRIHAEDLVDPVDHIVPLARVVRKACESAMILCEGKANIAALRLGISRHSMTHYMRKYRLEDGETESDYMKMVSRKPRAMKAGA